MRAVAAGVALSSTRCDSHMRADDAARIKCYNAALVSAMKHITEGRNPFHTVMSH
jgi:hypothetical protein